MPFLILAIDSSLPNTSISSVAPPGVIDALWVREIPRVEPFDVVGVAAVKEGGEQELFVLILSGHVCGAGPFPVFPDVPASRRGSRSAAAEYDAVCLASC